jgi:hypothetical protein
MDSTFVFVSGHRDPVHHYCSPHSRGTQAPTLRRLWHAAAAGVRFRPVTHRRASVLFPAGRVPRSRTLPRCCRPAPGAPPEAEPLPFFPLRTSSRPSHGHDVRTCTRRSRYQMKCLQFCHLIIYFPPFIRFPSDSSDSSRVEFVSSRSTQ